MSEKCIQHIEEAWKLKTEFANLLFDDGEYEESIHAYEDALYRAEVLNNNMKKAIETGIPYLQIYAISCNNIAFTYEKMGLVDKGEEMLKRVLFYLLLKSEKSNSHNPEIQSELKRAMLTYSEYAERNKLAIEDVIKVFADIQEKQIAS